MDFRKIYREANSEKEKLIEKAYSIIKPFIDKLGDLSQFHYDDIMDGYWIAEDWFYDAFELSEKEQKLILKWHKQMWEREPCFWPIYIQKDFDYWAKHHYRFEDILLVCFMIYTMKNDKSKAKEVADLYEQLDNNKIISSSKEALEWIHDKANGKYICPNPFY